MTETKQSTAFYPRPINRKWKAELARANAEREAKMPPVTMSHDAETGGKYQPVITTAVLRESADAFAADDAPINKQKGTSNGKI